MDTKAQFRFDSEELGLLESVLNEVLNGFLVPDFNYKIGIKRTEAESFLSYLHTLDKDAMTLDLCQTRVFRNALSEAVRELGIEEFQTRTGYDFGLGNSFLKRLDQLLGTSEAPE